MLKIFSGILLMAFGAMAQSADLETDLSSKVKVIPSYYPAPSYEQIGGLTLFGESMFSEKEVDCRVASLGTNALQQIPGLEHITSVTSVSRLFSGTSTSPVKTSVSGAWMRFGLVLGNNNVGATLVVDHVTLTTRGTYNSQIFNHVQTLGPGYCDAPFLYVVSPGNTLDYRPFSDNPLENLTLYLDGIPVVDSSESDLPMRVIPKQRVELTLLGWFVSREGSSVAPFSKRIHFRTPPLRFIKTNESGDGSVSSWTLAPSR